MCFLVCFLGLGAQASEETLDHSPSCTICYKKGISVTLVGCGHCFCYSCLEQNTSRSVFKFLETKYQCFVCRQCSHPRFLMFASKDGVSSFQDKKKSPVFYPQIGRTFFLPESQDELVEQQEGKILFFDESEEIKDQCLVRQGHRVFLSEDEALKECRDSSCLPFKIAQSSLYIGVSPFCFGFGLMIFYGSILSGNESSKEEAKDLLREGFWLMKKGLDYPSLSRLSSAVFWLESCFLVIFII